MSALLLRRFMVVLLSGALPFAATGQTVFTNDVFINGTDASYEGQDLVVSNGTLTVEGPHTFTSLRLAASTRLTHPAAPGGSLWQTAGATNELHSFLGTNLIILATPTIISSTILVTDTNGILTYTNDVDYVITNMDGWYALERTTNSFIPENDAVFVSYDYQTNFTAGVRLTLTGDFAVEPGAVVDADARGFGAANGPAAGHSAGSPLSGGGGGHGGSGGLSSSNAPAGGAAGSVFAPATLGSGGGGGAGGMGGSGGGTIQLNVGGNAILNGTLTANGQSATNNRAGGGAGGSIWIKAQTLTGNGTVRANGGAGEPIHGGGGGGGRIALSAATNDFTGTLSAIGGAGGQRGGAGTALLSLISGEALLTIDNGGFAGAATLVDVQSPLTALLVRGAARVQHPTGRQQVFANATVRTGSVVTTVQTNLATLLWQTLGDIVIESGASVQLNGYGYSAGQGPGAGGFFSGAGGGAGHGGYGGSGSVPGYTAPGGITYDSLTSPALPGSGGRTVATYGGGAGGGAIRLNTSGNLQLDGSLLADATAGAGTASGGGSGGSVWVTLVGSLTGSGKISAIGGSGGLPNGGGGGGGRIAVTARSNLFAGTIAACGGPGAVGGGAGTIYSRTNWSNRDAVLVDNAGLVGTNTPVDLVSFGDLVITRGAVARPTTGLGLQALKVGPNATLQLGGGTSFAGLTIREDAVIEAGGSISGDGLGYPTSGPGGGNTSSLGSTGGGHGGYGGRGQAFTNQFTPGGNAYDTTASPTQAGSSGGGLNSSGGAGGAGLQLTVTGSLVVDGRISVNGRSASTNAGGGGSGGGLRISANHLSGTGIISAEGGNGHLPNGGGGGGGRIAITFNTNSYAGAITARGGIGFVPGGAGTIYLKANAAPYGSVRIDNGGLRGTNTAMEITSLGELTLSGGAIFQPSGSTLSVTNLTITSNATLRASGSSFTVTALKTATIGAGAALVADGWISTSGSGSGQFGSTGSSGAGHGGYGGRGAAAAFGGNAYDFTSNPTQPGSPGGNATSAGGYGGGFLRLNVSGPLVVDGIISANGLSSATNNGGGGSGGSLVLTATRFSGAGLISADGGNGHLPNGGGGGGGRIAITWSSNYFTGKFSARGGNGFQPGGAGTIYLKPNAGQFTSPSVIVDNGGLIGTNTLLDGSSLILSNLTIGPGGRVASASGATPTYSLGSLNVASNGVLFASTINLTGPAIVAAGGRISADGLGFQPGTGTSGGAGASDGQSGGGGGHGGYGGRGYPTRGVSSLGPLGGNAYDTAFNPSLAGSGGGGGSTAGGAGGGVLRITANGPFTLDGHISANGLPGLTNGGGGGAGGSVIITITKTPLYGTGVITADGGDGHSPNGGGGGGGRISMTDNYTGGVGPFTNGFLGNFSAKGGNGFAKGGAGVVRVNTYPGSRVIVDNGGLRGTNTLVGDVGFSTVIVQGGALAGGFSGAYDLVVRSNGWLTKLRGMNAMFTITRDATFEAGGGIDLDGLSTSTTDTGATLSTPKGGGGYGGYGGFNLGGGYGSASSPSERGSPGGNGSGTTGAGPYGGAGGEWGHLAVLRRLLVDGKISADGRGGEFNSGGGSGGGLRIQAQTLTGTGRITAVGGNGNGTAGGGGGGRIAIYSISNLFTGTISAQGGAGAQAGGAGTIFQRDNFTGSSSLLFDNQGLAGARSPWSVSVGLATNVSVAGGAVVEAQGVIPVFSNLVVGADSFLTGRSADTNLYLSLLGDLSVASGGGISLDGSGFAQASGPGKGVTLSSKGSGAGHGGAGGASANGASGGGTYDDMARPVERGSGGGAGSGSPPGGSAGGGAVRLAVAGTLALDGVISANGQAGWQDDSGGGAGGSVWITAGQFTGGGALRADGGAGELFGGGGGGGGRIAVYSPLNTFTGLVSTFGGMGAVAGEAGTEFFSANLDPFAVIAQTPAGTYSNVLSAFTLEFNAPLNPLSTGPDDLRLFTPAGEVAQSNFLVTFPAPATLRVSFPIQNLPGDYQLVCGPAVSDLFGATLSQSYTGTVTVVLPLISGTVTDTNGQPVAGVVLQPSGDLQPTMTDANGNYALGVPPDWTGNVAPEFPDFYFAPGSRGYTNVTSDLAGQNYQMVASLAPTLTFGTAGPNLALQWHAYAEVTYDVLSSTNLVDWTPVDSFTANTNGPLQVELPIGPDPQLYFRLQARN